MSSWDHLADVWTLDSRHFHPREGRPNESGPRILLSTTSFSLSRLCQCGVESRGGRQCAAFLRRHGVTCEWTRRDQPQPPWQLWTPGFQRCSSLVLQPDDRWGKSHNHTRLVCFDRRRIGRTLGHFLANFDIGNRLDLFFSESELPLEKKLSTFILVIVGNSKRYLFWLL